MRTIKQQARRAGLLYLLVGISAPWGLLYVPGKLIVSGDATATADRIRASESLLRFGLAAELFSQVAVIFVVLALYRLFKHVSPELSRQLVVLGALVSVPIAFANALNYVAALTLLSGADFLSVFDKPQLDALAYFFVRLRSQGIDLMSVFWGLWLFPFGLLVIKSGFIPRFLGWLLIIAGVGYVVNSVTILLLPQYAKIVGQITMILVFGEPPIMLWLLIWGARGPRANEMVPA